MKTRALLLAAVAACGSACAARPAGTPADDPMIEASRTVASKPMPPEKAQEILGEVGENWMYGQGMGTTVLNVGAIVLFPPYALYVLGNSLLSYGGYEPLYVSRVLPDEQRREFDAWYDNLTSAPGRVTAALAGKEYRTKEVIRERMQNLVADVPPEAPRPFVPGRYRAEEYGRGAHGRDDYPPGEAAASEAPVTAPRRAVTARGRSAPSGLD